jgi:hypothetical protein
MADYYPLIAEALAGLEKSTGEARRALYDQARRRQRMGCPSSTAASRVFAMSSQRAENRSAASAPKPPEASALRPA